MNHQEREAHARAAAEIGDAQRDRPDESFICTMEQRFPSEREVNEMLTRKLRRRAMPPFRSLTLQELTDRLTAFLVTRVQGLFKVTDQCWFSGGASKIQMGFMLHWNEPGAGAQQTRLVLRMEPSESMNATSRQREFELLRAFAATVPVPRVYWVDPQGEWFPEPALIYAFAEGSTKPSRLPNQQISGTGCNFGPDLRAPLARQFVELLAQIHTFDHRKADLPSFDVPTLGTIESALSQFNRARRVWEEDRDGNFPLVEVAANWIERNLPTLDRISVIHGDYRSGNFLFREEDARITAVLDWERGYLGDRHRDLAWAIAYPFGHYAEDGKTFLACGLMPVDEMLAAYERASGLSVDPVRLRFFKVFNCWQLMVSSVGTGHRVARLRKSHQDIVMAWAGAAGYSFMEPLRQVLEEELA